MSAYKIIRLNLRYHKYRIHTVTENRKQLKKSL